MYHCTLTDPREIERRTAEYRGLGRDGLIAVERTERRTLLRFRPDPAIRRRVEDLVAKESRCCAFLGYQVDEEPDAVVLTVTAPGGGEAMMGDLIGLLR